MFVGLVITGTIALVLMSMIRIALVANGAGFGDIFPCLDDKKHMGSLFERLL